MDLYRLFLGNPRSPESVTLEDIEKIDAEIFAHEAGATPHDQKCWDLVSACLDDHPHIHTTDNFNALTDEVHRVIQNFIANKLLNYDGAPKS